MIMMFSQGKADAAHSKTLDSDSETRKANASGPASATIFRVGGGQARARGMMSSSSSKVAPAGITVHHASERLRLHNGPGAHNDFAPGRL